MKLPQLSLRDLFWLMLVSAVTVCWGVVCYDNSRLRSQYEALKNKSKQQELLWNVQREAKIVRAKKSERAAQQEGIRVAGPPSEEYELPTE